MSATATNAWPTPPDERVILERYNELERAALATSPTNAVEMIEILGYEARRYEASCRTYMKMMPGRIDADAMRRAAVLRAAADMLSLVDQKRDRVLPILFAPPVKQARR